MSAHKCPNCLNDDFYWQVDEEQSPLTIWDCGNCGYRAFEDEKDESECPDCKYPYRMKLQSETGEVFWWCTKCSVKTPA